MIDYDFAIEYFKKQKCTLSLDKESFYKIYKNNKTLMPYVCCCGKKSHISWSNFKKNRRCKFCGVTKQSLSITKYKINDILKLLKQGLSVKNVADKIKCSTSLVYLLARKHGIKIERWNNLEGLEIGPFVVSHRIGSNKRGSRTWLCRCVLCGEEKKLTTSEIKTNKSCGCFLSSAGSKNKKWKGYGNISRKFWRSVEEGALARGHDFEISIEYVWELFLKQNGKCAITGLDLHFAATERRREQGETTASLDRIDSNKGYTKDNVQWVYKDINMMKQGFNQDYFFKLCKLVVSNAYYK
jgi:hypothetical protein